MKTGMRLGAVINLLAGGLMVALVVRSPHAPLAKTIGLGTGGLTCIIIGVVLWALSGKMGRLLGIQDQLLTTGRAPPSSRPSEKPESRYRTACMSS